MTFNFNKQEEKASISEKIIKDVNYLTEKYEFVTLIETDQIYYYDNSQGIYIPGGEIFIKSELAAMHAYSPTYQISEIINTIKARTYINKKEFDSKIEWITCENCMINLLTGEITEHSSEFLTTIRIPVIYDKDATCPKIMKFLREIIFDERDVDTILDFIAYCLWREMKFQNFLILNGEGRNGKSTLCGLITAILGINNVENQSLDQLLNNRFSSSQLNGKLANIDADLSKDISKNIGMLKKLTGNDRISAEEKYKIPI